MPGRHQNTSPLEAATGCQDDLSQFQTLGCRVSHKILPNRQKLVHLGSMSLSVIPPQTVPRKPAAWILFVFGLRFLFDHPNPPLYNTLL